MNVKTNRHTRQLSRKLEWASPEYWRYTCRDYIGCPTRYRTRNFFNNFTTNEDIATKFEAHYRHTLQTHSFPFLTQRTYSYNIFIGDRIIKEMPGSVASGTHCIIMCSHKWLWYTINHRGVFENKVENTSKLLSKQNFSLYFTTLHIYVSVFQLIL